jgi:hypothetical protein
MIPATGGIKPWRPSKLAHRKQALSQRSPLFKILDKVKENPVQFRDKHLMDLMLEDMIVPVHAIGNHHERRTVFHKMPRHERMLRKTSWARTAPCLWQGVCSHQKDPHSQSFPSSAQKPHSGCAPRNSFDRAHTLP